MTTISEPFESRVLTEVRKWRKAAYEEDRARTPEQRAEHRRRLLQKFGLESFQRRRHRDGRSAW